MNNILITSAGRRVSLVRFFKRELKKYFPEALLYATDAEPLLSAGCYAADNAYRVRKNNEEGYVEELLELSVDLGVRIIIPTIDTELQILADHKALFEQQNIIVLTCCPDLIGTFRDKRKTSVFFDKYQIDSPALYNRDNLQFPLFIKPYDGSMSVDTYCINSSDELTDHHLTYEKYMFMEYVDSSAYDEYTIDMYYDRNHSLKCLVPRKRIEVRGGEINKGITVKGFVFDYLKEKLSRIDGAMGCLTMQLFYNKETNSVKAFEINPRFGGGFPLSYLAGANFPEYIIREYMLDEPVAPNDRWEEGLLMLRYDDEILVHGSNV